MLEFWRLPYYARLSKKCDPSVMTCEHKELTSKCQNHHNKAQWSPSVLTGREGHRSQIINLAKFLCYNSSHSMPRVVAPPNNRSVTVNWAGLNKVVETMALEDTICYDPQSIDVSLIVYWCPRRGNLLKLVRCVAAWHEKPWFFSECFYQKSCCRPFAVW